MVIVEFFGGPRDGERIEVPEALLRPVINIHEFTGTAGEPTEPTEASLPVDVLVYRRSRTLAGVAYYRFDPPGSSKPPPTGE